MMFSKMIAMTTLVAVTLSLASVLAAAAAQPSWGEFKQLYGKKYATPEEEARREVIYQANMRRAAEMAKRNPLATFGANEYADMSPEEFKVYHNADRYYKAYAEKSRDAKRVSFSDSEHAARPNSVDWRAKGAVTYVKNQGQCGSCWSFSTTGNIEGQWFLAGHKLVALSEQEFVSCDTIDSGCNGGLMDNAFTWVVQARGGWVTSENDYPYVSGAGQVPSCSISGKPNIAQITGHQDFTQTESAMATALSTNGPISIGVDASSWQTYSGGILTDCTATQVDHGVLLVGYDLSYSTPYWIIKNSWGASWGEQGYIRVSYGSDQCLITTAPSSSISGKGPAPPSPPSGSGSSGSGSGPTAAPPSPPSGSGSSGSGPVPPTPPASGTFTQYVCPDFLCLDNCKGNTFPQGKCLSLNGGGSAIVSCTSADLVLNVYTSSDCTGTAQQQTQPLDQCLQDQSGTYIYNTCSSSAQGRDAKPADASSRVHTLKQ